MAKYVNSNLYAFTVKYNKKDIVTQQEYKSKYDMILSIWELKGCKIKYVFSELDTEDVLHLHGKVEVPHYKFYRKSLCLQGFHLKLKRIFDEDGWLDYCTDGGKNIAFDRKIKVLHNS